MRVAIYEEEWVSPASLPDQRYPYALFIYLFQFAMLIVLVYFPSSNYQKATTFSAPKIFNCLATCASVSENIPYS
jgi:hypothetical protein